MMSALQPSKIQSLESLRGLAALIVVLRHLQLTFWRDAVFESGPPLWGLWRNADFAVRLFFVLSGFVLSKSYFLTGESKVVRSAAARRYFRLAIPAGASVFFAYALCIMGAMANHELADRVPEAPNQWLHSFYMVSPSLRAAAREAIFGAYFDFQYTPSLNVVLWTMAVELKGSLFVFATLALIGNARHRYFIYGAMFLILDGIEAKFLIDFLAGMAVCDWHCQNKDWRWNVAALPLFVFGLCLADLQKDWLEGIGGHALMRGARWWPTIAAICLLIGATRSKPLQRLLEVPPLVTLGSLSFSLYLFHLPLICSLGAHTYLSLVAAGYSHDACALVSSAVCVAASLVVAWIGAMTLDSTAMRLGRWFDHCVFGDIDSKRSVRSQPHLESLPA